MHTKMAFEALRGSELCMEANSLENIHSFHSFISLSFFAHFAILFVLSLWVGENGFTERSSFLKLNPCTGLPASFINLKMSIPSIPPISHSHFQVHICISLSTSLYCSFMDWPLNSAISSRLICLGMLLWPRPVLCLADCKAPALNNPLYELEWGNGPSRLDSAILARELDESTVPMGMRLRLRFPLAPIGPGCIRSLKRAA